jgi:hypothetical protein
LALRVTSANEQDRDQVAELAAQVQAVTGQSVEVAFVDQGYTGNQLLEVAAAQGIRLEAVKAARSQEGLCPLATSLGRGAEFRVDCPVPTVGTRL